MGQGLAALDMDILVRPLQGALTELVGILPELGAGILILAAGVLAARFVGRLVSDVLTDAGFNGFVARVGLAPARYIEEDAARALAKAEAERAGEPDRELAEEDGDDATAVDVSEESGHEESPPFYGQPAPDALAGELRPPGPGREQGHEIPRDDRRSDDDEHSDEPPRRQREGSAGGDKAELRESAAHRRDDQGQAPDEQEQTEDPVLTQDDGRRQRLAVKEDFLQSLR